MHRTGSLPILILAAAALARGPVAAAAAEPPVWELRPYRIQVLVGVASRPELAARWPAALAARLTERILALQGAAWDATVAPAPPALQQAMAASLAGVTADALPKDSLDADKVMLVQVSAVAAGGGYQVAAREFDTATGLWSAVVVRPVRQLSKLPDLALAAIFQAFAPLARVSAVDGHRVVLRLRASALKPHDPELAPVRPGAVFRLAARKVAGQDAAKPAVAIPWTFCTVEEVAEEELRGRLETGLRDPLPERWETAIEVLALGVVPPRQATVLTLNSTSQPPQPLAGYDIYASPAAAEEPVLLGRTDRRGSLRGAGGRSASANPPGQARRAAAGPVADGRRAGAATDAVRRRRRQPDRVRGPVCRPARCGRRPGGPPRGVAEPIEGPHRRRSARRGQTALEGIAGCPAPRTCSLCGLPS